MDNVEQPGIIEFLYLVRATVRPRESSQFALVYIHDEECLVDALSLSSPVRHCRPCGSVCPDSHTLALKVVDVWGVVPVCEADHD